ncbi:MAG: T9SS type A sorting domain-containing protein [Bacteroidota bacterium]
MRATLFLLLTIPFTLFAQLPLRLDTSFAQQGVARHSVDPQNEDMISISQAIGVQSDGKIILGGYSDIAGGEGWYFTLMRLFADGSVDESFGINGVSRIRIRNITQGHSLVIQPDDKIILAGTSWGPENGGNSARFALARFTKDGSPDRGFGQNGQVWLSAGSDFDVGNEVLMQLDGRILLIGQSDTGREDSGWGILRLLPDGSFDPTFGTQGKLVLNMGFRHNSGADNALVLPDGQILVSGSSENGARIIRLNPDGTQDLNWGENGFADFPDMLIAMDLAVDSLGRVLCALAYPSQDLAATARLLPDGQTDTGFGQGGVHVFQAFAGRFPAYHQIEVLPTGEIIGFGSIAMRWPNGNDHNTLSLLQYDATGKPETDFGQDGLLQMPICPYDLLDVAAIIMPDQTILLTGACFAENSQEFALVRLTWQAPGYQAVDDLRVYPNPSTGQVLVDVPAELAGEILQIVDLRGRVIAQQIAEAGQNRLSLQSAGMYVVRLQEKGWKVVVR